MEVGFGRKPIRRFLKGIPMICLALLMFVMATLLPIAVIGSSPCYSSDPPQCRHYGHLYRIHDVPRLPAAPPGNVDPK